MDFPSLIQSGRGDAASADAAFSAGEVLDCLSDGIVATTVGGDVVIVYVNPAACEITGYAAEELLGNYRKDGTPFVMEWSISTLHGPDGAPAFHMAVQRDATLPARRLLEAEHDARSADAFERTRAIDGEETLATERRDRAKPEREPLSPVAQPSG